MSPYFRNLTGTGNGGPTGDIIPPSIIAESNSAVFKSDIATWEAPTWSANDDTDGNLTANVVVTYSSPDPYSGVTNLATARTYLDAAYGNVVRVQYDVQDAAGNNATPVYMSFFSAHDFSGATAPQMTLASVDYDNATITFTPNAGCQYNLFTNLDGMIPYNSLITGGSVYLDYLPSNTFIVLTLVETNLTTEVENYSVYYFNTTKVPYIWGEYRSSGSGNFSVDGNNKVLIWNDRSGNGNHLYSDSGTRPNAPTNFGIGGPGTGVEFGNGGSTYLSRQVFENLSSTLFMMSFKVDLSGGANTKQMIYDADTYNYGYGSAIDFSNGQLIAGLSSLDSRYHTDAKVQKHNIFYYSFGAANKKMGFNGTLLGDNMNFGSGSLNNGTIFYLGGNPGNSGVAFTGRIYNLMILANNTDAASERSISALEKEMKLKTYRGY